MAAELLHAWVYVVIPAGAAYTPYMIAYCKQCSSYFSEAVPIVMTNQWGEAKTDRFSTSHLPRFGCHPTGPSTNADLG